MPDEEKPAAAAVEEPKGDEPKSPEHMIPKSRFDEVSKRAQSYERMGTPDQIGGALQKLAYYEELERQAVAEAESKKGDGEVSDETAKKLQEANAALYKVEPKLAEAVEAGDFVKAHNIRCRLIATEATADILRESGEEPTRESVMALGKRLKPYFDPEEYPALHALFFVNPEKAVEKAHKLWKAELAKESERGKKPDPQQPPNKLPHTPTPRGGSPPTGKEPSPPATSTKDVMDRVTAKLKAMGDKGL